MRLTATIIVEEEPALVKQVFAAEDKAFKHGRSAYTLAEKDGRILITITANDPTALRATVTSVTRILNIVEKTR